MKRVRCPKCDNFITFDETKYSKGSKLVFVCPQCGKQFAIRMGVSKLRETQDNENPEAESGKNVFGQLVVVENGYHYKQIIPLHLGENTVGRYMKNNDINCPIETGDLKIDLTHCHINVSKDKNGKLKYVLRDGPSYHGTSVNNERLSPREQRVITNGQLINIGESTIILRAAGASDEY